MLCESITKRPFVLTASADSYELRFLETLLEEKARKAEVEQKEVYLLLAKPVRDLRQSTRDEIERLAGIYASGGARADFFTEAARSKDEPLAALLSTFGVQLQWSDMDKQALDLGLVCCLLFSTENRQPDQGEKQLRENFVPELASSVDNSKSLVDKPIDSTPFNVLSSWGEAVRAPDLAASSASILKQLTGQVNKKKATQDDIVASVEKDLGQLKEAKAKPDLRDEVYQHITDALTGLLNPQQANIKEAGIVPETSPVPPTSAVASQSSAPETETNLEQKDNRRNWPGSKIF